MDGGVWQITRSVIIILHLLLFLHSLFTLQITKSTLFFSCLCCCSTHTLPPPHTPGTPKPQRIFVCQRYPQLSWKRQLFLSKVQQKSAKWGKSANLCPRGPAGYAQCSVTGDPKRLRLHWNSSQTWTWNSSMPSHTCPGPACGHREALLWFGQFSFQLWGNILQCWPWAVKSCS